VAQSAGVGFAVPVNVAKDILPQLREKGKVARGWLGITIQRVDEDLAKTYKLAEARGASVSDVEPGSPADKAGILPDDVIVTADGRKIQDNSDLSNYVASRPPGATVKLEVIRKGASKTLSVTLGTFPDESERTEDDDAGRNQLGMTLQDVTPALAQRLELPRGTRGVVVTDIEAGGAAEDANPPLQRADVIVSVNGTAVESVTEFEAEIQKARKDSGVARLRVRREGGHRLHVLRLP
jgi:serine protease Do